MRIPSRRLLPCLALALLAACSEAPAPDGQQSSMADTAMEFRGQRPCADCSGIESWLRLERRVYVEGAVDPAAYCALCKETFGPVVTVYESLADDPDAVAALDRSFLDFATRSNAGHTGGPAEYPYEYLLAVARKAG